jgi:hypothetical protein
MTLYPKPNVALSITAKSDFYSPLNNSWILLVAEWYPLWTWYIYVLGLMSGDVVSKVYFLAVRVPRSGSLGGRDFLINRSGHSSPLSHKLFLDNTIKLDLRLLYTFPPRVTLPSWFTCARKSFRTWRSTSIPESTILSYRDTSWSHSILTSS